MSIVSNSWVTETTQLSDHNWVVSAVQFYTKEKRSNSVWCFVCNPQFYILYQENNAV